MRITEYFKLARSFNAVLTGVSPIMGALVMEFYDIPILILLFFVGFLGHTFGFVYNDIVDYKIDSSSKGIKDRPLVSGTISLRNAWIFALSAMFISINFAIIIAYITNNYYPILVLIISAFFVAVYDKISKKAPGMDIFVTLGVFFLILYGSSVATKSIFEITPLAIIICTLGGIQVLFMQIVAGGMKDIENDYKKGAKTIAVKLGVRVNNGLLTTSISYRIVTYLIQIVDIILVFLPFLFIWDYTLKNPSIFNYFQWIIITIIFIVMIISSTKLISMKRFDRDKARRYIGIHYYSNFSMVPIMLMILNPWIVILIFFPAFGFIFSNLVLHGTFLQPKTM